MRVEVINTGTELLLGHVMNTHLRFLAEALFPLGLRIDRQVTVPDGSAIRDALLESFSRRAEIVFVTGGLGPTTDDITREITAELLGLKLEHDDAIMSVIEQRFVCRGLRISPRVSLQAQRPKETTVLQNANGTAPGLYFPPLEMAQSFGRSPHLFLLPGPPRELIPMFEESVVPILSRLLPQTEKMEMRSYRVVGLGESIVEEKVGGALLELGLELGYCARPGEVDVRTIGRGDVLAVAERIIVESLGTHIASTDSRRLEKVVVDLLTGCNETLATAESCTGGGLAHTITNVPGASKIFLQGHVTYANEAKSSILGVDPELIAKEGAVSEPVARAMAEGTLRISGASYALSTTGIAGPDGGTEQKPVGTVFIALAANDGATKVVRHRFPTDRATFKDLTIQTALDLLRRTLVSAGSDTP